MMKQATSFLCGVAFICVSTAAVALPHKLEDRAELFATCSGRLAAVAARMRGYENGDASESDMMRDTFNALLDAVLPMMVSEGVPESQAAKWRNRGWAEIAHLFADADYSFDAQRAERARHTLTRRIAVCRDVLL
jgi:hypothetical protein